MALIRGPAFAADGAISGTITGSLDGSFDSLTVELYAQQFDPGFPSSWQAIISVTPQADGTYIFPSVPPGDYRIGVADYISFSPSVIPEFYDNQPDVDSATTVTVEDGQAVIGIDMAVEEYGKISGIVTDQDDNALLDVPVTWFVEEFGYWNERETFYTDPEGKYTLTGLPAGNVRLRFGSEYDTSFNYVTEYYDDAADVDSATDISVNTGMILENVDAQLVRASRLSGNIVDANGDAVENVEIYLYRPVEPCCDTGWDTIRYGFTEPGGQYEFSGLLPGLYRVGAIDMNFSSNYVSTYYENATNVESATNIIIEAGVDKAGINIVMQENGKIEGTVTDENGDPLSDIPVTYYLNEFDYWSMYGTAYTGADGTYTISGVTPGYVRIGFGPEFDDPLNPFDYVGEFYNDAPDLESATNISVTSGTPTTGIDAQLAKAGKISGTVTNYDGQGAPNVEIQIFKLQTNAGLTNWDSLTYVNTAADGTYSVGGLIPGTYRVGVYDFSGFYSQEVYYDGAASVDSATDIVVGQGEEVVGIDMQLAGTGTLAGKVLGENQAPLSDIDVRLYRQNVDPCCAGWETIDSRFTGPDGLYRFEGILAGTYRLEYAPFGDQLYYPEYYENRSTVDAADDIVVAGGETVTLNDVQLDKLGVIEGTVTDIDGAGVSNIEVIGYYLQDDGNGVSEWVDVIYDTTDENGKYRLSPSGFLGEPTAGTYRICFQDFNGGYVFECYNNSADVESAEDIALALNQTVADINAVLEEPGSIGGTVSDSAEMPISNIPVVLYRYDETNDIWVTVDGNEERLTTGNDGKYIRSGLLPGKYRVEFDGGDTFVSQFYDGAASLDAGTDIELQTGQNVTSVNAQLIPRAVIKGTVTDDNGIPLSNIFVGLYSQATTTETVAAQHVTAVLTETWNLVRSEVTDNDGKFAIYDMEPGTYRIGFNNSEALYHSEFFGDEAYYISQAADIEIGVGSRVENVNVQMAGISLNVPPLAQEDALVVEESGESTELVGLSRSLLANDEDAESAPLTAMLVVSPTHGTLTLNPDGTFAYKHDGSETLADAFAYVASDGTNTSDVISVTITVQPVNDVPVGISDSISLTQGSTVSTLIGGETSVLANDSDDDSTNLTVSVAQEPAFGTLTLNADGTFVYNHVGGESKTDQFTYTISDGEAESEPVAVTLRIDTPVGDGEPIGANPPGSSDSIYLPFVNP